MSQVKSRANESTKGRNGDHPAVLQPQIGIPAKGMHGVVELLNTSLADEYVLFTRTQAFHWNVTGPHFHSLHELFEKQYQELSVQIDALAERVRQVGGFTPVNVQDLLDRRRLDEIGSEVPKDMDMVHQLLQDHESIIRETREAISQCEDKFDDVGTADFLTDVVKEHEKMAWMLRSFLTR